MLTPDKREQTHFMLRGGQRPQAMSVWKTKMTLELREIWEIEDPESYKVHFARWSEEHPLDVWVKDPDKWRGWQESRGDRNRFSREFIFSLMQFYPEAESWLFGGVWRVTARHSDRYSVELTDQGRGLIGRLKLRSSYKERTAETYLENNYDDFEVLEILREPYTGERFPGYEKIDRSFLEVEAIVNNERADWKTALEHVKGVYLITDTKERMRYVGSAYGESGIWSRWAAYVATGHGGNIGMSKFLQGKDWKKHCRENFRFALLEQHGMKTPDENILARERYWQKILQAGQFFVSED